MRDSIDRIAERGFCLKWNARMCEWADIEYTSELHHFDVIFVAFLVGMSPEPFTYLTTVFRLKLIFMAWRQKQKQQSTR